MSKHDSAAPTGFDVSRDWAILIPQELSAGLLAGTDLSRLVGLLRTQAGLSSKGPPPLLDASRPVDETRPIIVLNASAKAETGHKNGYSWRTGMDRIEIYGASDRGLCNGVYDFLSALDIRWPRPGREILPQPSTGDPQQYPLNVAGAYQTDNTEIATRRRLVISRETPRQNQEAALVWAVRNRIDAITLPLQEDIQSLAALIGQARQKREALISLAKRYALTIEIGGWDLSALVPRRYFLSKNEAFRMEEGKRVKEHNFCPTSPDAIALLNEEAARCFRTYPDITTFHLWPDRHAEHIWCSCPSCRAFSREEQNRIAVNSAADVLATYNPNAQVSYYENSDDPAEIAIRPNMFALRHLPGEDGAEEAGLYLAEKLAATITKG
ncbi:hypothetical protein FACS1894130_03720 [Spirochaetia bacterium]|nr:hypothetical protein FACS1894130_03720 [Spirochaetia bacterium]